MRHWNGGKHGDHFFLKSRNNYFHSIISTSGDAGDQWHRGVVNVNPGAEFYFIIEGMLSKELFSSTRYCSSFKVFMVEVISVTWQSMIFSLPPMHNVKFQLRQQRHHQRLLSVYIHLSRVILK